MDEWKKQFKVCFSATLMRQQYFAMPKAIYHMKKTRINILNFFNLQGVSSWFIDVQSFPELIETQPAHPPTSTATLFSVKAQSQCGVLLSMIIVCLGMTLSHFVHIGPHS